MLYNILAHTCNAADSNRVNNLRKLIFLLRVIKSNFKGSYDEQNLTLTVFSYEIYEGSFHKFHIK